MLRSQAASGTRSSQVSYNPAVFFSLGALLALASVVVLIGGSSRDATSPDQTLAPQVDILRNGPLGGGIKVPLEQAMTLTPYSLPVPPTNDSTGARAGVWIDLNNQVGFVWETLLRFYVDSSEITEDQAVAAWTQKVATEPESGRTLTTVRGHVAIGTEGTVDHPSSLTFIERGLGLQFVSPSHTLEELRLLAEQIAYE